MVLRNRHCIFSYRGVLFVLFFIITVSGITQDNVPYFLKNTDWLPSQDAKKWEKLVNQLPDADQLLQKSNDCYLQMATVETDGNADEKKKQKQLSKLEEQAINYYNQSLQKYKEIYLELYSIISKNLDEPQKGHPAYQDMNYYNEQASTIYSTVTNVSTDQDREQFSQANEYQLMSIEKGISVFNVAESSYVSTTQDQSDISEPVTEGDIQLNAEMYNKYKEYISNTAVPDPVVISQLMQMEGDYTSFEAFKEMWNNYLALEGEKQMLQQQIAEAIIQTDSVLKQDTAMENVQTGIIAENVSNTGTGVNNQSSGSNKTKNGGDVKQKTGNTIPENLFESSVSVVADGPEYRVQLAASRTPLNLYQVSTIYNGPLSVIEVKDGNLYKYQVRSFTLYSDAQTACSQTKVDNAYLAAYDGSTLLDLGAAIRQTRPIEAQVKKLGKDRVVREIEFTVQIAASRVRLTSAQLGEIYSGQWPVSVIFENGWYKYQIIVGRDMQEALNVLGNCGVNKAFLVAYKNGRKLILYKALHEYKSYTP